MSAANKQAEGAFCSSSHSHSPSLEETKLCWSPAVQLLFTEHLLCTGAREVGCQ